MDDNDSGSESGSLYEDSYEDSEYAEELMDDSYETGETELIDDSYDHNEYAAELLDYSYEEIHNDAGEKIEGPPELSSEKNAGEDGKIDWETQAKNADEYGFDKSSSVEEVVLPEEMIISRYGSNRGHFATDKGTSYDSLSLPYDKDTLEYHEYRVVSPVTCQKGIVAENFEQKGGGTQYMFSWSFAAMERGGMIVEVKNGK